MIDKSKQNIAPVRILFSAINGYGHYYLKTLFEEIPESDAVLVGIIDPEAHKSGYYSFISGKNIPIFNTIDEYFNKGFEADLTVISSPPQYHVSQAVVALENGSNVLVDKPVGVNVDSVKELIETAENAKRWVEVGYQWTFSKAIQDLKRDILDGIYGDPLRFKTICLWPREHSYYNRNSWAGKIADPMGQFVLDSPANNACAHFLHNLLFLLGDVMDTCAMPQELESKRFRAYDIENFDTISLRVQTNRGAEVLFYASHVSESPRNPEFVLEFEKGLVELGGSDKQIVGRDKKGLIKNYGHPDDDHQFKKLFGAIRRVKEGGLAICPPEAAIAQTICINMIHESKDPVVKFPDEMLVETENRRWVRGLGNKIDRAYEGNCLI